MMEGIMLFFFNNIIIFLIIGVLVYFYRKYKSLKLKSDQMGELFKKVLFPYLDGKIKYAKQVISEIQNEYFRQDTISTEINRFLLTIEKADSGSLNDIVYSANSINKFRTNKKIDMEKYPMLERLNTLFVFTKEEIESVDNGLAISRREYNSLAFKYNEEASGFLVGFLLKITGLPERYIIFDKVNYDEDVKGKNEEVVDTINLEESEVIKQMGDLSSLNIK